jgi:hypothetical protein
VLLLVSSDLFVLIFMFVGQEQSICGLFMVAFFFITLGGYFWQLDCGQLQIRVSDIPHQ